MSKFSRGFVRKFDGAIVNTASAEVSMDKFLCRAMKVGGVM